MLALKLRGTATVAAVAASRHGDRRHGDSRALQGGELDHDELAVWMPQRQRRARWH